MTHDLKLTNDLPVHVRFRPSHEENGERERVRGVPNVRDSDRGQQKDRVGGDGRYGEESGTHLDIGIGGVVTLEPDEGLVGGELVDTC